jgi:hypothetical protein
VQRVRELRGGENGRAAGRESFQMIREQVRRDRERRLILREVVVVEDERQATFLRSAEGAPVRASSISSR